MFNRSKFMISIPVIVAGLVFVAFIIPLFATIPVAAQEVQQSTNSTQERLWALGEPIGLFGPLNFSGGVARGEFVQFTLSENQTTISDYKVNNGTDNATVFSEMYFTGLDTNSNITINGPLFQMVGNSTAILIHNNPTALIQVVSMEQGNRVGLTLAEGMKLVENVSEGATVLNLTGNGIDGTLLIYNGTASQVPGNDTQPPAISISFDQDGALQFRCAPKVGNSSEANEKAIQEAFARADLGGEAWVTVNGSNYIYEDATINGITPHVETASVGEVRMLINASAVENKGKLVLVNIDNQVIDPKGNLSIAYNNESVSKAADLASVINATNSTNGSASFFAMSAGNITKYLIYLPSFQENNTLVISTSNPSSSAASALVVPGIVGSGLLIVAATLSVTRFLRILRPLPLERRP